MDKEYILTGDSLDGEGLFFKYNSDEWLIGYREACNMKSMQRAWLFNNFPFHRTKLFEIQKVAAKLRIQEVETDLSFKRFWDEYAYKVGKKKRAERMWNNLSKANKVKALRYIRTYNSFLAKNEGLGRLYPETYLHQERWNN